MAFGKLNNLELGTLQKFALDSEDSMYPVDPEIVETFVDVFTYETYDDVKDMILELFLLDLGPEDGRPYLEQIFGVSLPSVFHSVLSSWDTTLYMKIEELHLKLEQFKAEKDLDSIRSRAKGLMDLVEATQNDYDDYLTELPRVLKPLQDFLETSSKWSMEERIEKGALIDFGNDVSNILEGIIRKVEQADFLDTLDNVNVELRKYANQEFKRFRTEIFNLGLVFTKTVLKFKWAVLHGSHTLGPMSTVW